MIKAIFFARFDPEKGPIVLHATPSNSIATLDLDIPSATATPNPHSLPLPSSPLSPASPSPSHPSIATHLPALPPASLPVSAATAINATKASSLTPDSKRKAAPKPLLHFPSISPVIIPHQTLCNRRLSLCVNGLRVLGHPICISDSKYPRNEFIFNLCLVLDEQVEFSAYVKVVDAIARLLEGLEREGGWLATDEREAGEPITVARSEAQSAWDSEYDESDLSLKRARGASTTGSKTAVTDQELVDLAGGRKASRVKVLCEMLMEDLNSYSECMIPVDDRIIFNHRLSPILPPPPAVKPWHVPVPTTDLVKLVDSNWDITMLSLLPYIDGISTVASIAHAAGQRLDSSISGSTPTGEQDSKIDQPDDVEQSDEEAGVSIDLATTAISDLLYYGVATLIPPPTYSAVYAPTPGIRGLIRDDPAGIVAECASFVLRPQSPSPSPEPRPQPPPPAHTASHIERPATRAATLASSRPSSSSSSSRKLAIGEHEPRTHSPLVFGSEADADSSSASTSHSTAHQTAPSRPLSQTHSNPRIPSKPARLPRPDKAERPPSQKKDLSQMDLIELYTSLRPGLTLRTWYTEALATPALQDKVRILDLRRFVIFGLAKGWLFRQQKFAALPLAVPGPSAAVEEADMEGLWGGEDAFAGFSSHRASGAASGPGSLGHGMSAPAFASAVAGTRTGGQTGPTTAATTAPGSRSKTPIASPRKHNLSAPLPLRRFLDGLHSFDEICTELGISERELLAKIRGFGDVVVVSR